MDGYQRTPYYGKPFLGTRPVGRPSLHYEDVCKWDMKFARINLDYWEDIAANRDTWRLLVKCSSLAGRDKKLGLPELLASLCAKFAISTAKSR